MDSKFLRIELLGGFRVRVGDEVVAAEVWRRRKVRSLVKLLALAHGYRLHREQVMELLWPEADPQAALNSLHQTLYLARRILDPPSSARARYLFLQDEIVTLGPPELVWVDVVAFEDAAAQARQRQDVAAYQAALALYKGELLPEDRYEEWASARREALHQEELALLRELTRLAEARADYALAIETLHKAVAADPAHEEVHRDLMRLYALTGARQQALRQYQALQEVLRQELDLEPDIHSQRLYQAILAGQLSPSDPAQESPAATALAPSPSVAAFVATEQTTDSPPLKSLSALHNLPVQITSFIGREREIAEVQQLLATTHLLTLAGPGGCGKTRLALAVAADLLHAYSDGVWLVDLAALADPALLPQAVAAALGLREAPGQPLTETLATALKPKQLLLLLDNCEHLIIACAHLAEALLRACPQLRILATSREALHIPGEVTWLVPSLSLPEQRRLPSLAELLHYEAIRLFVERARAILPTFRATEQNAPAIAQICRRLDGVPLAIELAAARLPVLSVEQLAARLDDCFRLLTGGSRTALTRQQTLKATLDWSYDLLTDWEQALLRRLAVFAGGFTLEAAEAICAGAGLEAGDVLDLLSRLVAKSLVVAEQQGALARYRLLETVRQYSAERLEEDPEFSAAARHAHASYFAGFTRRQWERMTGYARETALGELEADIENVRSAWRYWVADGDLEQLGKLTDGLWLLNDARGWYHATVDLTADLLNVLAATPSTPDRAQQQIMVQTSLARALMAIKGYTPEVEAAYTRALELCQGQGEIPQLLPVLRGLASFYLMAGELEKGAQLGAEILSLAEHRDDASMRVEGHLVLGGCLFSIDLRLGLDHLEKAIALYDRDQHRSRSFRIGNNPGVACFTTSALVLWMLGFPDRALKRADEAVALANRLNHPFSMAYALFHTGLLHLWRREVELVQRRAQAALEIAEEHEFQIWKALAICLHGAALAGMGRADEGLLQVNRGIDLYQELKTPPIFWPQLVSIRAGVCAQAGRPAEGVILLDEVLDITGQKARDAMSAELYRLKGELLLALAPENPAEPWFRQALEIAQERQASMVELRAAMSLSRLWREQGKAEQGRRLLRDAYGKLTEGFTTADLKEASALLADSS